jgi:formate dehydrogenase maturation protein FdhE
VCEVSVSLHVEKIENAYREAITRILDKLEAYEERRIKAIQEALRDVDIEQERERIKRIMSEIREKNGRARRS